MADESGMPSIAPVHFTYKLNPDKGSLCQGDVLEITTELRELITKVHPYFNNEHYKYFIVLTQSCDLVRRDCKPCKSPYITLAVVREFSDFFCKSMVSGKYAKDVKGLLLLDSKQKTRAQQFIERIYNNTEPDYFFLYEEPKLDFPKSMVAYLKVSIALKSEEHYEKCLTAKKIELTDEFKAKLGWLVGNIYSRVGTTDWDSKYDAQTKEQMIKSEVESRCIIAPEASLKKLKEVLDSSEIQNASEAKEYISSIKVETKYEKGLRLVKEVLDSRGGKLTDSEKNKIMKALKSKNAFKTLLTTID